MIEKHIITVGDDTYIVHMHLHAGFVGNPPSTAQADVYEAVAWENADGSVKGVSYCGRQIGGTTHEELNDDCVKPFTMTVCWRGCWDERCYAGEEEYWDGDFAKMASVEAVIKPVLRKMVCNVNELAEMED
jgi:hypothetical protein